MKTGDPNGIQGDPKNIHNLPFSKAMGTKMQQGTQAEYR